MGEDRGQYCGTCVAPGINGRFVCCAGGGGGAQLRHHQSSTKAGAGVSWAPGALMGTPPDFMQQHPPPSPTALDRVGWAYVGSHHRDTLLRIPLPGTVLSG